MHGRKNEGQEKVRPFPALAIFGGTAGSSLGDLPLRLPLAQAAAGVLIALAQHQEQRAGNVDRAVGADHYADHHHEGEQMNAWYHYLLHNQTAAVIKAYLLFSGFRRVVVINVPWYLSE
jgi:hypothetical protein